MTIMPDKHQGQDLKLNDDDKKTRKTWPISVRLLETWSGRIDILFPAHKSVPSSSLTRLPRRDIVFVNYVTLPSSFPSVGSRSSGVRY
ncbi:hypothetical protein PGT21_008551 [Puccinia graminis f. sp. tritici]|uniref:Uncharacterized protein n=1 Tax=Puccinia graminis f. sp. tritici TaxID=56615 RepID=A0A5B0PX28_PUCGR|nr:hypothetical protein PGT21_008551 [Puccinia graminis f. sp. tritici]